MPIQSKLRLVFGKSTYLFVNQLFYLFGERKYYLLQTRDKSID